MAWNLEIWLKPYKRLVMLTELILFCNIPGLWFWGIFIVLVYIYLIIKFSSQIEDKYRFPVTFLPLPEEDHL